MPTPIENGKDFNKFKIVTASVADFPENPQFAINFRGQEGLLMIMASGDPVEYSFNGTTVHGKMTLSTDSSKLQFDHRRVSHIWFRSTGTGVVEIHAWAAK